MNGELTPAGRDAILNGQALPAALFVTMHAGEPGSAGVLNTTSMKRQGFKRSVANNATSHSVEVIEWRPFSDETLVSHISIHDRDIGGFCWFTGKVNQVRKFLPGDIARIAIGEITLSVR